MPRRRVFPIRTLSGSTGSIVYSSNRGLAPIQKRDPARGLALDNLMAPIQSRSTDRRPGKISIIMPAYNASSTLALAIESILGQTWDDIELIVVDDCSTDDTFEIAQRYAAQDPRVTAVRQPRNMGAYAARNAGVRLSTGDFITVHDCDDWSHPKSSKPRWPRFSTIRDCSAPSPSG